MIDERIGRLKKALRDVVRTRTLHRAARRRVPYPIVALVGYTNAGKSTLFNRLTGAEVTAEDQLFATLDPTMRAIKLPSGRKVILSDTVGFVSDLPTDLVAAFRATLEEVIEADVILHVGDAAHPDSSVQADDVARILAELGVDPHDRRLVIEVHNKIDRLNSEERELVVNQAGKSGEAVAISALEGAGVERLRTLIDERLGRAREILEIDVAISDGAALAWLHEHGDVIERREGEQVAHMRVALDPADAHRYARRFGRAVAE
jgi:GTP-binding protein HflX